MNALVVIKNLLHVGWNLCHIKGCVDRFDSFADVFLTTGIGILIFDDSTSEFWGR